MYGIPKAFKIKEEKTSAIWQPQIISIFWDSQTIIDYFKQCKNAASQVLKMQIYQKAKKLVQQKH